MKRILFAILACALTAGLCSLGYGQKPGNAKAGKDVFLAHCAACHGADGNGKDAVAKLMNVTFPKMSSDTVQKLSDAEIEDVVTKGKLKMKPVAGLSKTDLANVTAYVRTFATPAN